MRGYDGPAGAPRLYIVEEGQREPDPVADPVDAESDRSLPPATAGLLIVIVSIFLWMQVVGHGNVTSVARQFGAKASDLIAEGQWWRLVLPIFLHGSWIHLLMNGLTLAWFGGQMERLYGARKFFLIYMVAGIAGNVLSYMMLPGLSLGASGALFGLIGAGLIFPLRFRRLLPVKEREAILKQLVIVAGINLALSFSPGIDRYAHFGGFIGGGVMALFLIPDVLDERPHNRLREAALTLAATAILGITLVAAAKQWSAAQRGNRAALFAYGPGGQDAWWQLDLNANWKPVTSSAPGAVWLGPGNARISAVDSVADPDLYEETERWRAEADAMTIPTRICGQSATLMKAQEPGKITEMCRITAFQRTLNIRLVCSPAGYEVANNDFQALLNNLRLAPPRTP